MTSLNPPPPSRLSPSSAFPAVSTSNPSPVRVSDKAEATSGSSSTIKTLQPRPFFIGPDTSAGWDDIHGLDRTVARWTSTRELGQMHPEHLHGLTRTLSA